MTSTPVICFGQQPCGFFPKRFLVSKIWTARRLQSEIGGEIVFFYHDSDHDPRETRTILRHRKLGEPIDLNFAFANSLQRKYSPLYLKRVLPDWHEKMGIQLPQWVERSGVEAFKKSPLTTIADFCLEVYRQMGLMEGVRVVRSSDPEFRRGACPVSDFFVDTPYSGEIVRARFVDGELKLHKGGNSFLSLPPADFTLEQVSPTRDTRLKWMQSVVCCTHYVAGAGEQAYMRKADAPEITYLVRDSIERSDEAFTDFPD
jgi:hypothetical protein